MNSLRVTVTGSLGHFKTCFPRKINQVYVGGIDENSMRVFRESLNRCAFRKLLRKKLSFNRNTQARRRFHWNINSFDRSFSSLSHIVVSTSLDNSFVDIVLFCSFMNCITKILDQFQFEMSISWNEKFMGH